MSGLAGPQVLTVGLTAGAPTTGSWVEGQLWFDSNDSLWICQDSGTPGNWIQISGASPSAGALTTGGGADSSTSASYHALATPASVTITTNTLVLVTIYGDIASSVLGQAEFLSFAISSATTLAASDTKAVRLDTAINSQDIAAGASFLLTVTAGSNVFALQARVSGGATGTVANGAITVIPLN